MLGVVVRLSMAFCMIGGACLSVRADPAVDHQLRALAHFTRGEFGQAIADSTAALRAEPNSEGALRVRGLAQLYAGQPKAPIGDFAASVRLSRRTRLARSCCIWRGCGPSNRTTRSSGPMLHG